MRWGRRVGGARGDAIRPWRAKGELTVCKVGTCRCQCTTVPVRKILASLNERRIVASA